MTDNRVHFDLDDLLHPAQAFSHPSEVVNDPDLTLNEKRAILASWASDACAIEAAPALRPAAKAVGAKVDTDDRLFEGKSAAGVLELLATVPDSTALCSHGDVIPETLDALVRRGCEITTIPDWRKGSVWALERGSDGEIVSAEAWPPSDSAS